MSNEVAAARALAAPSSARTELDAARLVSRTSRESDRTSRLVTR